jgi:hypothetical protein
MRATWSHGICITGAQLDLFFGLTQEEPDLALDNIERILDMAVRMPGHLLSWRDLEFADAESGPFGVVGPALNFVEMAGVLEWFHVLPRRRTEC